MEDTSKTTSNPPPEQTSDSGSFGEFDRYIQEKFGMTAEQIKQQLAPPAAEETPPENNNPPDLTPYAQKWGIDSGQIESHVRDNLMPLFNSLPEKQQQEIDALGLSGLESLQALYQTAKGMVSNTPRGFTVSRINAQETLSPQARYSTSQVAALNPDQYARIADDFVAALSEGQVDDDLGLFG